MARRGAKRLERTPELIKAIVDTIRVGGSDVDACHRAGISQDTFYRWMKVGEFSEQITRARVDGKLARIARINKAGSDGDWRADAWYLERRWPEEFAQQLVIKVTHEQAALLKQHGLTAAEAFEKLIQSLHEANNG